MRCSLPIVNNNLVAYDQSRDLAFAIDSAIKEGAGEEGGDRRSDGSTESLSMNLAETEVHEEMEDTCRCAPLTNSPHQGLAQMRPPLPTIACSVTQQLLLLHSLQQTLAIANIEVRSRMQHRASLEH